MTPPITRISSDISLAEIDKFDTIIDVRSPAEFADDHIPGAINLPVLDDQQRAEIGTFINKSIRLPQNGRALLGGAKYCRAFTKPLYKISAGLASACLLLARRPTQWRNGTNF